MIASSFFLIYNLSKGATGPVDGKEAGYQHNVNLWTTPTFVLSVCINIYCSCEISRPSIPKHGAEDRPDISYDLDQNMVYTTSSQTLD